MLQASVLARCRIVIHPITSENKMRLHNFVALMASCFVTLLFATSAPANAQGCDLTSYRLFVDPGHGGSDSGAVGPTGLTEAFVNLEVGLYLRDWLEYFGATVGMSRTTDVFVPLTTRAAMANQFGADRFVSTHENSFDDPTVNGTETFTVPNASSRTHNLAESVLNELLSTLGLPNRGVRSAAFAVLVHTVMPATLSESSFISNPDQEAALADPDYRFYIAYAHAQGICDHLAVYPTGAQELENQQRPEAILLSAPSQDSTWQPQAGTELELVMEERFSSGRWAALAFDGTGQLIASRTVSNANAGEQRGSDGRYTSFESIDSEGARLITTDAKTGRWYDLSAFGVGHQNGTNISYQAAWSKQGDMLLVSVSEDDGHEITSSRFFITDPRGEQWMPIFDDGAAKISPTWFGRKVAFFDSKGAVVVGALRERTPHD